MPALLAATADRRAGDDQRAERGRSADRAAASRRRRPRRASPEWKSLRANSAGWIPITVPLRTRTTASSRISDAPDLRGGFDPELAISLLIRSQRRPSGGRHGDRLRDVGAPERVDAATPTRCARRPTSSPRLEPGVRLGLGYDGGAGNVERRDRAAPGLARDDQRGDDPDRAATHRATRRTSSSGRRTTRASSPATSASSCTCASWASRASSSIGDDRGLRPRPHQPLVPLAGRERIDACARDCASTSTSRPGSTEGAGFSFSADGALATRARTSTRQFTLKVLKLHGALDPVQRPDPRRPRITSTSAARCGRTGRRRSARSRS